MDDTLKKETDLIEEEKVGKTEETTAPSDLESAPETPELNNNPVVPEATPAENPEKPVTEAEKKFSQDDVNEMMGQVRAETRDRTFKYIYGRYGVENEDGLDNLVGNAQRFDTLKETYDNDKLAWAAKEDETSRMLADLKEKIALMESGIDKDRYEDAKFILKGKGLEITAETIQNELATHPEWKRGEEKKTYVPEENNKPQIKVPEVPKILGNENSNMKAPEKSEEEIAMEKYFRVK